MYLSLTQNLNYESPGGQRVPLGLSIPVASYAAMSAGSFDVPPGSPSGTAFQVPLGSVATPIGMMIVGRNMAAGVFFNGQTGGTAIPIATGGVVSMVNPRPVTGARIVSAVVVTLGLQGPQGQIDYLVFGD